MATSNSLTCDRANFCPLIPLSFDIHKKSSSKLELVTMNAAFQTYIAREELMKPTIYCPDSAIVPVGKEQAFIVTDFQLDFFVDKLKKKMKDLVKHNFPTDDVESRHPDGWNNRIHGIDMILNNSTVYAKIGRLSYEITSTQDLCNALESSYSEYKEDAALIYPDLMFTLRIGKFYHRRVDDNKEFDPLDLYCYTRNFEIPPMDVEQFKALEPSSTPLSHALSTKAANSEDMTAAKRRRRRGGKKKSTSSAGRKRKNADDDDDAKELEFSSIDIDDDESEEKAIRKRKNDDDDDDTDTANDKCDDDNDDGSNADINSDDKSTSTNCSHISWLTQESLLNTDRAFNVAALSSGQVLRSSKQHIDAAVMIVTKSKGIENGDSDIDEDNDSDSADSVSSSISSNSSNLEEGKMSPYELKRFERIKRNDAYLEALGLGKAATALKKSLPKPCRKRTHKSGETGKVDGKLVKARSQPKRAAKSTNQDFYWRIEQAAVTKHSKQQDDAIAVVTKEGVNIKRTNPIQSQREQKSWTVNELTILVNKQKLLGNDWKAISKFFSRRSCKSVECKWRQLQVKKVLLPITWGKMGNNINDGDNCDGNDDGNDEVGTVTKQSDYNCGGSSHSKWTSTEHNVLIRGMINYGTDYIQIASVLPGRTATAVKHHIYNQLLHTYTMFELSDLARGDGTNSVQSQMQPSVNGTDVVQPQLLLDPRTDNNCGVAYSKWTSTEHNVLIHGLISYGKDYTQVATLLPGRTRSAVSRYIERNSLQKRTRNELSDLAQLGDTCETSASTERRPQSPTQVPTYSPSKNPTRRSTFNPTPVPTTERPIPLPSTGRSTDSPSILDTITDPNENDVLCGRGKINLSKGNLQFEDLVQAECFKYVADTTTSSAKTHIAVGILFKIRAMDPAGRFLKQDHKTRLWWDTGDANAIEKIRWTLRRFAKKSKKAKSQLACDLLEDRRIDSQLETASSGSVPAPPHFPSQLHDMLDGVELQQQTTIVSWCPDGHSFRIHQPKQMLPVLGQYFRQQTKYKSFLRQLQVYNFQLIRKGERKGTVSHPRFQRGQRSLCFAIKRKHRKRNGDMSAEASAIVRKFLEKKAS